MQIPAFAQPLSTPFFHNRVSLKRRCTKRTAYYSKTTITSSSNSASAQKPDVIVIGSGLGGLSAAALLSATYKKKVLVLESHTIPGGAAHSFSRTTAHGKFIFDSGPHLFSGLSSGGNDRTLSANPMQHVLRSVKADVDVISYDTWGCLFPEGYFATRVTPSQPLFSDLIRTVSGEAAASQVADLLQAMVPLCKAATSVPPAALRAGDAWGSLRVASRYFARSDVLSMLPVMGQLSKPFGPLLEQYVTDEFGRNFIELLCFLLAGVGVSKIPTAEVAFMFSEWTGITAGSDATDCVLEHPIGGAAGIVEALVNAVRCSDGSDVRTGAHVERVLFETMDGRRRAVGVALRDGQRIYARESVISNVSSLNLRDLIEDGEVAKQVAVAEEFCASFMHLHLAIELTDDVKKSLPHQLELNYVSVEDWSKGLEARDNVVLISIPSLADSSLAPEGHIVLHAYTPATEAYDDWRGVSGAAYEQLKEERSQVLWRAVEKIIPNVKQVAHVQLIGSPLTHERFLRRKRGSYGPAVDARRGLLSLPMAAVGDVAEGFLAVGDGVFPGIGVPAVAASGWLAANALVDVAEHQRALKEIGL